jgi:protein phosphatase
MPVQTLCPHCKSPCLVNEQYFGTPVGCYQCGRSFVVPLQAVPQPAVAAVAAPPRPLRLEIGSATSPGRVRDRNEDSYLVQHLCWSHLDRLHEIALLAIADGMGGYEAGDQASAQVIASVAGALGPLLAAGLSHTLPEASSPALAGSQEEVGLLTSVRSIFRGPQAPLPRARVLNDISPAALGTAIHDALLEANRVVYHKSQNVPACKGMGATAAVVLIWEGQVQVGHVGDCRVYHQRGGQLTQVTRDQTLVARMLEMGQITPAQAAVHPARNEVAQAVGRRLVLEPGRYELQLARGDWLVVACDGLHTHVEPPQLQDAISRASAAPLLAQQLVDLANQRGGTDNCTVIVVRCF